MPPKVIKNTPDTAKEGSKPPHRKMNAITIFSFVILIIIVVTFIGAPVVSSVAGEPGIPFGSYDGVTISFQQGNYFSKQVEQMNQYMERFGQQNMDLQRQMVWRQAFEQTAKQVALEKDAKDAGIMISDARVDRALAKHPRYSANGKFSEEAYNNTSAQERFALRGETKTELLIQQYYYDLAGGPKLSKATTEFIEAQKFPQRKFSFVVFEEKDFPDAQVAEYGLKNKDLFRTINLSRITITSSESDAAKVRDEATKTEKPFEDLVKTYSKDALNEVGGAMNLRAYHELKGDFEKPADLDALFALAKGEISPVVKTTYGWVIFKVIEASQEADFTNGATLSTVRTYIGRNDKGLVENYLEKMASDLKASVQNGQLAQAAQKLGKAVETTDFMPLNFGNLELFPKVNQISQNPVFQGLGANEDFFTKAWKLKLGEISEPILASPAILLIKLDEVRNAPEPMVYTAKDTIASTFIQERSGLIESSILESNKFKDEFASAFTKLFPEQQPQ